MIRSTIASLILLIFIAPLFVNSKDAKKRAYQWWHVPCFALLYVVAMYILFHFVSVAAWPVFSLLLKDYDVEAAYVLLCAFIWQGIRLYLHREAIHKKLIVWYRKGFSSRREDRDKVLPFPYFFDSSGVLRARVGRPFYHWMLGGIIIIIALIYSIFFFLTEYLGIKFYLISSFGLFGLIPLVEYFHYLKAEVPEEEKKETPEEEGNDSLPSSNMEKLWKQYIETYPAFSMAWKRKFFRDKESGKNNQDMIDILMKGFMGTSSTKGADGFLENCNLVDAFTKISPLFDWEKENGLLVLIVMDIPNHFSKDKSKSYLKEIADELKKQLNKENDLIVFDEYSSNADLNTSITVSSLSELSSRRLNKEWMKRIGLVIVVNLFDKSVSNLYECRKFSSLLRTENEQYQLLFITPHLNEVEPTLKNTWDTKAETSEKTLIQYPHGYHQFFIGYNLEDYLDRFKLILKALPSEPLSAGSELIPIALSHKLGETDKVVTPIHFFDLAYTNIIEGVEELGKSYRSEMMPIWEEDMNKQIHCHLLPLDKINEDQILSVIFDQNNNAPAAYSKWIHLGQQENFSIVLSRPYLFRDYFNANHDFFVNNPFLALQPFLTKSRITLAVILLEMLQKSEMSEEQLRSLLQGYYNQDEIKSVSSIVQQLFTTYFANDLAGRLRTRQTIVFDGSKYHYQTIYQLDFSDSVNLSYLDRIAIKDESDNVLFVIIKDLLFQNFDKGQTHSFSGKPYEVISFDSVNRVLKVRATNTKALNVSFYKPVRRVTIGSQRQVIEDMNIKPNGGWAHPITKQKIQLDIEGFETSVSVVVDKWYEFSHYHTDCPYFDASLMKERKYKNGRVLKVTFRFLKKKEYIDRKNDIRKSLQILLYEAMQSIFPHHAQYLIISSIGEGDPDLPWIFNKFACNDRDDENALSFYFIEDAHVDLGLIGALAKDNIMGAAYLFRYIFDYLMWLTEGEPVPAGGYDEFLHGPSGDKFSFLKYGREQLPAYFDVDLLINFIRDFFCQKGGKLLEGVTERTNRQDTFGVCDFCRKKMKNSEMQRLDDGRMRCPDCSKDAIDTEDAFRMLCDQVKTAFKTHLGIDFNSIPHNAKLVSAVELHKVDGKIFHITNGYDVRKFIGLACNRDTDVFYVENGYKPEDTYGTIAHEMTHIWQYNDPDFIKIRSSHEQLVEGLAVWTDLYLSEKNGKKDIEELRASWLERDDEYGEGLRFIMNNCPDDPYGYIRQLAK